MPEVEKIGLATQTDDEGESASSERAGTSSPERPSVSPPAGTRRVHPIVLLVLLVALAGVGFALGNELQRTQQLEERVAFLGDELGRAHDDLAAYQGQMDGVRSAVSDLRQRMSALQTLVDQDPVANARP